MGQNKNVHKIHKRCKIFVKRLASKFQKDLPAPRLKNSHLESAFRDTVDSLPEESLREKLLTNFDKYAKLLQKYCDVNKDKEETGEDVNSYSDVEFPYNLYLKDGHIISDKVPESEKDVLCCHVWAKKLEKDCVRRGRKRIFEKLEEPSSGGSCSEVEVGLKMTRLCTGIKNPQVILTVMKKCLSKFQSSSESCISKGKTKQVRALSEKVHQFLMICHIRYHNIQQRSGDNHPPHYEDLMAAYLSIYIDLCLVVAKKEENCASLSKRVCSFTVYLLSQWPYHILDVLLQLTGLELENADVVLPLISKAFQHKPDPGNNKQYLKYILTVVSLTQKLDSKMEEIKQETLGLKAPKDFLSWLQEEKPEALEEMPEDRKFKGRQITRFLLEDMSEDLELQLMDLLTDDSSEGSEEEETGDIDKQEITSQSKQKLDKSVHATPGHSLFYLDTKGTGTNDQQSNQEVEVDVDFLQEVEVDVETTKDIVIRDEDKAVVDNDVQEEENGATYNDDDSASEKDEDIAETFFVDKKSNDDLEMVDDSEVEVTSVVQDTIKEVQETLKNVRMTRHARKLFETSKLDSNSPKKTKEVKYPFNQIETSNFESMPADTEQTTKRASVKFSAKKSPGEAVEESIIIPDSDIEETDDNFKFDFIPEISSHLQQTPLGKKMTNNQKTPISRRTQKQYDGIDQSDSQKVESEDLMSPVISLVRTEPSRNMIQSLKTGLVQTTRLRTRSLTESDKLDSDKKASKPPSRKSITGCKPVVMDESLQMLPIEDFNTTQNNLETVNTEHDVIVGGYSLRQTRKRTLSEASNSSVLSRQSVTEKQEKTRKTASSIKTPKSKNITRIDDVVLIEMSDSELSSPTKKPKNGTKTIKINNVDVTEMSDSEGLGPEDAKDETTGKTLVKVDKEITFNIGKTKDILKPNRRKSEPGNRKLTTIKDLKSTKSRRYSLRQK